MTMQLISTITAGSGVPGTLQFSSIPQTYTDLLLVFSLRRASGSNNAEIAIRFNGSTSNYLDYCWYGYGGGAAGSFNNVYSGLLGGTPESINGTVTTASTFSNGQLYIPNYTGSTAKQVLSEVGVENNAGTSWTNQAMFGSRWNDGSAINNIQLVMISSPSTFDQYSTVSLYGITKGSGGATVSS